MQNSPPSTDAEAQRERQLASDLQLLRREREEIKAAFKADVSSLFQKQQTVCIKRLQVAADHRDLQLASLRADFHLQLQQAYNEFESSKRRLRMKMLSVNVEKRKRLDAMRSGHKKRKRSRSFYEQRATKKATVSPFLSGLERQGVLRVSVTPDELMADMNDLLSAIDVPTHKSATHLDRVGDGVVVLDKIHSSKGTLHYHDLRLEKGDAVELYSSAKSGGVLSELKGVLKYRGVLLSVNSREVHIRADDGTDHRVYVSHLRSGRFSLKPAGGANSCAK